MTELRCSSCSATQREAKQLIAGPAVFICAGCVQLCCEILVERRDAGALTSIGEHAPTLAALSKEVEDLRGRERELHSAIVQVARAAARVLPTPLAYLCVWCEATLDGIDATREHVTTCAKHPAVIKLREAQSSKRRRAR